MIADVKAAIARRAVLSKGFEVAQGPRDHEVFFFCLDGKKTNLQFKISHGSNMVEQGHIRMNAKNWRIRGDDLYRIVCCDFDAAKTREILLAALK